MLSSAQLSPSAPTALSLDWLTQKSKEAALTRLIIEVLHRYFGPGTQVRALEGVKAQTLGDFEVQLLDGSTLTIEAKFEDFAPSWFPEVLQLTTSVCGEEKNFRIENGWASKSTSHLLLNVSTVTGQAFLVPRLRALQIQVPMLQALMLASRKLEVPLLLYGAINPPTKHSWARVGVGLGLLKNLILHRYRVLYGNEGLFQLDIRPELEALQATFRSPDLKLQEWVRGKVLSEKFSGLTLPGLPLTSPWSATPTNSLQGLGRLKLSAEPITPDGIRFFQAAALEGLATGQLYLAPQVTGEYRKLSGTFATGSEAAWVTNFLPTAEHAPGRRGNGSHHELQRRLCKDFSGLLRELDKEGLQSRREEYLMAVRRHVKRG